MKYGIKLTMVAGLFWWIVGAALAQEEFKPSIDYKGSRFAAGYLDSQDDGSYPAGSYQMPEVKLRLNWAMNPDMTVVTRFSANNAGTPTPDYFYLDYKNLLVLAVPSLKDSPFNPTVRLGRFKLDIGEETWSDNPVESVLISNSAPNAKGYDEGLQLFANLPKEKLGVPMKWSLSFTNGNAGSSADNEQVKALCLKIGALPLPELYVSGSYYNSGELGDTGSGAVKAEASYGNLVTPPTNATKWTRTIMELDVRYDFQPGKENRLNPGAPSWSDSKAFVRAAYGKFMDDGKDTVAPIVQVVDRKGKYSFIEGVYNATEKVYLGLRQSTVGFDKSTLFASLNGVNANKYTRTSVGAGYRLSDTTHIKFEYVTNSEDVPTGTDKPKNNQIGVLITTKF